MRKQCAGIETEPVLALCRPEKNFWVFKATVYKILSSVAGSSATAMPIPVMSLL